METFLQQYGLAIMVAIIIAMMILVATPVGDLIRNNLLKVVKQFLDNGTNAINNGYWNSTAQNAANLTSKTYQ